MGSLNEQELAGLTHHTHTLVHVYSRVQEGEGERETRLYFIQVFSA